MSAHHGTPERTRWAAVVALAMIIFLAGLDMTIAAIALPAIGDEFGVPAGSTQWVQLGYLLPLVALVIPVGRWLDSAALRPVLVTGALGFRVASALIAAAPGFALLTAGRAVQGAFAAAMTALIFPAVSTLVEPQHRGRAFGLFATLGPIGTVAGPAVGGALIEAWGWRATFLVHLPVALAVAWLAHRTVPGGGRLRLPGRGWLADALGLGTVLVAAFVALDRVETVATADVDWFGIGAALALAAVAGGWWVRRADSRPVLDVLGRPALWPSLVALPLGTATSGGLFFLIPYLLVTVVGSDSVLAGTTLAALPLAMALCSPLAGWLADHISPRRVAAAGALVAALGALGLQTVDAQAGAVAVAWPLAVVGIGAGLFTGPNSSAILSATPDGMAATVGAVTQMGRTLGFALGPAVAALTWHLAGGGIGGFHLGAGAVLALAALAAVFAAAARTPSGPVEAASPAPTEQHVHESA